MACVSPGRTWYVNGKWVLAEPLSPELYKSQEFACGQCSPCRLSNQGEWTVRLMQEALMHSWSICATATYAPEHLPEHGSLSKPHATAFVKALRQIVSRRGGAPFSVDVYGEYSPWPAMRPHLHIALFGYCPPDAKEWSTSRAGNPEFISAELSRAWGDKGRLTFQHWSHGAAQYCAGHQSWKLTGDLGRLQRQVIGPDGQVIAERAAEFHVPSKRPGIGRRFFERYGEQSLQLGYTVSNARQVPVPGYYMRRADVFCPELAARARAERQAKAVEAQARLADGGPLPASREYCAAQRIERSRRKDGL